MNDPPTQFQHVADPTTTQETPQRPPLLSLKAGLLWVGALQLIAGTISTTIATFELEAIWQNCDSPWFPMGWLLGVAAVSWIIATLAAGVTLRRSAGDGSWKRKTAILALTAIGVSVLPAAAIMFASGYILTPLGLSLFYSAETPIWGSLAVIASAGLSVLLASGSHRILPNLPRRLWFPAFASVAITHPMNLLLYGHGTVIFAASAIATGTLIGGLTLWPRLRQDHPRNPWHHILGALLLIWLATLTALTTFSFVFPLLPGIERASSCPIITMHPI
jgi:uncharacterized membrane protein